MCGSSLPQPGLLAGALSNQVLRFSCSAEQRPPCAAIAQVHWLWCSKTAEELPPGRWFRGHLLFPRKKFEHSFPELEPFLCSPSPVSFTSVAPVLLIRKGIGVGWMCRPFLSLLQASQVDMACVPCPGEEMDHSHALWTSLLISHSGASVDYSRTLHVCNCQGLSLCLDQENSSSKHPFILILKMAVGLELPLREDPPHVSLLFLRGFISSFPSSLFSPNLCLPTFARSLPCWPAPTYSVSSFFLQTALLCSP